MHNRKSHTYYLSVRRAFSITTAIAVGLAPIPYLGIAGIGPSILLSLFCLLIALQRYRMAAFYVGFVCLLGLALPAFQGARPAMKRMQCESNLKKIISAIIDYEDDHGHLPPPYSISADGTPLHSWRVLLLPYLGYQDLFDDIDLSKPWDDPANQPFHEQSPDVYHCPSVRHRGKWKRTDGTTNYVAIVGARTSWPQAGRRVLSEFADGFSVTWTIVESEPHRLPWMAVSDPSLDSFLNTKQGASDHKQHPYGSSHAAALDGSTTHFTSDLTVDQLRPMLLINDGSPR